MDQRLSSKAIFARLGRAPCDADFELVHCDRCGRQYLVDHETLRVYTDPNDLSQFALNTAGEAWPPCSECKAANWNFVVAEKVDPEWRWACAVEEDLLVEPNASLGRGGA